MAETEHEEDENAELLTVMREECDEELLILLYKWEFLDIPAEHHDRIMIDTLLKVMKERGIQVPTVLPDGEVDFGKYAYLKDYNFARFFADLEKVSRENQEE